jgi:hypothetical protein
MYKLIKKMHILVSYYSVLEALSKESIGLQWILHVNPQIK